MLLLCLYICAFYLEAELKQDATAQYKKAIQWRTSSIGQDSGGLASAVFPRFCLFYLWYV